MYYCPLTPRFFLEGDYHIRSKNRSLYVYIQKLFVLGAVVEKVSGAQLYSVLVVIVINFAYGEGLVI